MGRFFPRQRPPPLPGLRRIPALRRHRLAAAPPRTTPSATWTSTTCRLCALWSDLDQELYERALNVAPEVDRPNISKGRPRIPHLRKVLTERGQAFKTSDKVETLWRLCAESHAKAAADAKAAASQYAQSGIDVNEYDFD